MSFHLALAFAIAAIICVAGCTWLTDDEFLREWDDEE